MSLGLTAHWDSFFQGRGRRPVSAGSLDDGAGVPLRHAEQVREAAVNYSSGKPQRCLPMQLRQRGERLGNQVGSFIDLLNFMIW